MCRKKAGADKFYFCSCCSLAIGSSTLGKDLKGGSMRVVPQHYSDALLGGGFKAGPKNLRVRAEGAGRCRDGTQKAVLPGP